MALISKGRTQSFLTTWGSPVLSAVEDLLVPVKIVLINLAIFFGHYVIISTTLNLQFGNAGIPNMSSNVSLACGAYVVSGLVIRICMWIGSQAGLAFKYNWVYDNPYNVALLNGFFETRPLLSLGLFLLSLSLVFAFGSGLGWLIGAISGRLRAIYLMMFLLIISDAGNNSHEQHMDRRRHPGSLRPQLLQVVPRGAHSNRRHDNPRRRPRLFPRHPPHDGQPLR